MSMLSILLNRFALSENDSQDDRLQKVSAIIISGCCTIAGLVWFIMYAITIGNTITTYLPLLFVIIVGLSIVISHFQRNHLIAVYTQIVCILYITAAIQWTMGGVYASGFVLAWSIIGPLTALVFLKAKEGVLWLTLFLINILITLYFDNEFSRNELVVSIDINRFFFIMNLGMSSIVVFIFARYFVSNALREKSKSELLLLNILPAHIASELKETGEAVAQNFQHVSILFTDFRQFTQFSQMLSAKKLVAELNSCFSAFDALCEKYGIEKIKTIGDSYMAAGGLRASGKESVKNTVLAAIAMSAYIQEREDLLAEKGQQGFQMRVGIHTGPVVAGIVGVKKFQYDIWGDTVNTASRMESHGVVGKVNISQATYELIKDDPQFTFEHRGKIEAKGKGEVDMYFVSLA